MLNLNHNYYDSHLGINVIRIGCHRAVFASHYNVVLLLKTSLFCDTRQRRTYFFHNCI